MKRILIWIGLVLFRNLLKLRYKITYRGLEEAIPHEKRGVLFLSNHPAIFVDGLIASMPIIRACQARPLIVESMFFSSVFAPVLRLINALAVPDFGTGSNSLKMYRLKKVLDSVVDGLEKNESFLIYPAGMTKQTGREVLGGAFAVHDIVEKRPDVPIVMIRIVGLWGSRFSRAQHRGQPVEVMKALKDSFLDLLKAAIFFLPRREVEVTFERVADFPRKASTAHMNQWMERWFNAPFEKGGEPLTLISYSPWTDRFPDIQKREAIDIERINPEVKDKVLTWLAEALKRPKESFAMEDHLVADLGLDSLALADLATFLEAYVGAPRIAPQDMSTVASICLAAQGESPSLRRVEPVWSDKEWVKPRKKQRCWIDPEKTIVDHFLATADEFLFDCAAVDTVRGPLSYRQIKQAVLVLAYYIKKHVLGDRVAILLPDTIAAHITVMACQLAGKTPVMLNWTVGARHLEQVVQLTGLERVLTSWSFVDLLENVDLKPIQEKLLFLEECKASCSWMSLLTFFLGSFVPYRWSSKLGLFSKITREDAAVLLFTSGTESEPKGVVLTHSNIMTDLRGALEAIPLFTTDRLMSILPPFHSFGFSVTGIMPLLAGIPTYFFSNPTEGGKIADKLREWKITLLCAAPSFLKHILFRAQKEPLEMLRLIVTGAEKAPTELFSLAQKAAPQARLIEGYGITECSPILTINARGESSQGVGHPIEGVHILIVNPERYEEERPQGEDGLILASGPNVFSGYLQPYLASPFYRNWYVTGDIGHLTKEGGLVITGRLKRFIKLGGEMVSLGAIEDGLFERLQLKEDEGPSFAIISKEDEKGVPQLLLFTKTPISESEANLELRRKGFSNLIRIDRVYQVKEIPMTALGKVSIGTLDKMEKP